MSTVPSDNSAPVYSRAIWKQEIVSFPTQLIFTYEKESYTQFTAKGKDSMEEGVPVS